MYTSISCTSTSFERVRGSKSKNRCRAKVAQSSSIQNTSVLARYSLHNLWTHRGSISSISSKLPSWHRPHRLAEWLVKVSGLRSCFADLEVQRQVCKQMLFWCSLPFSLIMPDSTLHFLYEHWELNSVGTVHFALMQLSLDCYKSLT